MKITTALARLLTQVPGAAPRRPHIMGWLAVCLAFNCMMASVAHAQRPGARGVVSRAPMLENTRVRLEAARVPINHRALIRRELNVQAQTDLIVVLNNDIEPEGRLTVRARVAQRNLIRNAQVNLRGRLSVNTNIRHEFNSIPAVAMTVDSDDYDRLLEDDQVQAIYADEVFAPNLAGSHSQVTADLVHHEGFEGHGRAVAVIDSGVDRTHPALAGRVISEACFSTESWHLWGSDTICGNGEETQYGPGAGAPCDGKSCSHGTHVAGIVASGHSWDTGMAPGADIVAIQAMSQFRDSWVPWDSTCENAGRSSPCFLFKTSDVIRGLEYVVDLVEDGSPIDAVNMSLGGGKKKSHCSSSPYKGVINNLYSLGVAVVIASGNDGFTDAVSSPGCVKKAVTVGAVDAADAVASFSNSDDQIDLLAPGVNIDAPVPDGIGRKSGTSMATPHVAGAIALLRSVDPNVALDSIIDSLTETGVSVLDSRNGITRPRLDIEAAYNELYPAPVVTITSPAPFARLKQYYFVKLSAELELLDESMAMVSNGTIKPKWYLGRRLVAEGNHRWIMIPSRMVGRKQLRVSVTDHLGRSASHTVPVSVRRSARPWWASLVRR
ncbi:MAG: S8 family serine peptidase [Myxococcota bacterium]|nr:S8 family serine peptidase [Myxococcota bacterium]